MAVKNHIKISTYNCKHFNDYKVKYIKYVLGQCDFMFLQEHCLFKSQFDKLYSIDNDICFCATSAMDEGVLLSGRPHGGCSIIWKSSVIHKVDIISCESNRICAISLHLNGLCFLLVNVYMPCDDRRENGNINEFIKILDEVSVMINRINPSHCILGGDFNTDFRRRTPQSNYLKRFIESEQMYCFVNDSPDTIDYTFSTNDGTAQSVIDHIIMNSSLRECLINYKVISHVDNMSDHVAIICSLSIPIEYCKLSKKCENNYANWSKATKQDIECYQSLLDNYLLQICMPYDLITCTHFNCTDHNDSI